VGLALPAQEHGLDCRLQAGSRSLISRQHTLLWRLVLCHRALASGSDAIWAVAN
jgi:hypothetical protein